MSFCNFSKEYNENSCTEIENRFITKYLPEADGFFVKVYLYGLYLCRRADPEFSVRSMAEVLNASVEKIKEAFYFWQDYDLVEILSDEPLTVNYLAVRASSGRPKKIRYDKYGDFNKEMQRRMQQVKKFVSYGDSVRYMQFLEENDFQPQAFLLITEYCIHRDGENVSAAHILNKAKKFLKNDLRTYEQVEKELSGYDENENELARIFTLLSVYRKPDESDYALYRKWTEELGFDKSCVFAVAKRAKKGGMSSLNAFLEDLSEKGIFSAAEAEEYFSERETLSALTFKIASKLGVKIANPAPFIEEYAKRWYNYGFDETSLCKLATFCFKSDRADFSSLDELVHGLFKDGIVSADAVNEFLNAKNNELKLFTRIRALCGNLKKNTVNLTLIETWHEWNFSDEMILEAATRSAGSNAPVPYMNKILSEWKQAKIFSKKDIPEQSVTKVSPDIRAIDEKTERERFYAALREKARTQAEKNERKADENPNFKEISKKLSLMELSVAKAELSAPDTLPALLKEKTALLKQKKQLLADMGMSLDELTPQYRCKKCSDTGFLKNGALCDCYIKA